MNSFSFIYIKFQFSPFFETILLIDTKRIVSNMFFIFIDNVIFSIIHTDLLNLRVWKSTTIFRVKGEFNFVFKRIIGQTTNKLFFLTHLLFPKIERKKGGKLKFYVLCASSPSENNIFPKLFFGPIIIYVIVILKIPLFLKAKNQPLNF